jgi:hypothetical protein
VSFALRLLVNEAEDECQHDRTPLFDRVDCERIRSWFQDFFAEPRKWLRPAAKLFRGRRRMKQVWTNPMSSFSGLLCFAKTDGRPGNKPSYLEVIRRLRA